LREEFFKALKKVFYEENGVNLPIYGVPFAKLKDYATSKKDMKKGVEMIPEENYRLRNEDIYEADGSSDNNDFGRKGGHSTASSSQPQNGS